MQSSDRAATDLAKRGGAGSAIAAGMARGYFLGIGTNIEPEQNILRILGLLVEHFGRIWVSRFYWTDPAGMVSTRPFINACGIVRTDLGPAECKAICVSIEN